MRLGRVLGAVPVVLTAALAACVVVLVVRKVVPEHLSETRTRLLLVGAGFAALVALVVVALRRLPPRAGALALDRHHGLADRLTSALAFDEVPAGDRSPLMEVAIDDALAHADGLRPGKAAPLRPSRDLVAPALVAVGAIVIGMLEVPRSRPVVPQARTIDAVSLTPDDLDLFRQAAKDLERKDQSEDVKAAIERFNQLIDDIAHKRLDRNDAFRQMEAIERDLLKGAEADAKALEDALRETGDELAKSDLAKPLGESLKKKDLDQAKKDLQDLAKKLRDKKKPDKAQLERLRQALERAAQRKKDALAAINEKRAELSEDLLKKKKEAKERAADAGADDREERLLKKKQSELDKLDREAERLDRSVQKLDRLDRDLAKAAADLMKDLGVSADDLEQAAQDINRFQDEEMSDKEKEELRQRLEELREVLRQQGQAGKDRMARMMRFGKRARGGKSGQGEQPGERQAGSQGQGEEGEDGEQEGQEGEGQEGQQGKDGKDGEGQQGKGGRQPGKGQQIWVIGPGGKKILVPAPGGGEGQGRGKGEGQGQGEAKNQGEGEGQGDGQGKGAGKGIGSQHDSDLTGKATDPKVGTQDVQAEGLDTGQGPKNSEVIQSAAERGFSGGPYKKVYKDYRTAAEQQIGKDQIPDGYRFYVRRYFQLIRPRE